MKRARNFVLITAILTASNVCQADETSDTGVSLEQLKQLSRHVIAFTATHEGRLPKTFAEVLGERQTDKKLLVSPLAADQTKPSYELLTPAKKSSEIQNPDKTALIRSVFKTRNGDRLIAFADGHVGYSQD